MKKLLLTLTAVGGFLLNANAQTGYVRFGGGYAFPQAGQTRGIDGLPLNGTADYTEQSGFTSIKLKRASFASGGWANLAIGCMINDHVGLELNGMVGIAPAKYTSVLHYNNPASNIAYTQTIIQHATTPFLLAPSLVLKTGKKIGLYMRAGVVIPVLSKLATDAKITSSQGRISEFVKTYSAFSLGFSGAAGLNFNLTKNVNFYVEASVLSMSLYLKEEDYFDQKVNLYYKTQTNRGGSERATYSNPFSNAGANIGFSFTF